MTSREDIFVWDSWKDKVVVDELDTVLRSVGVYLKRDIRDIDYRQSIKAFMKSIRRCRFAVIVLTDSYLKSPSCMYEILEFVKDDDFSDKIVPIVLDMSVLNSKIEYIHYWENKARDLRVGAASLDLKNTAAIVDDLRIHDSIASTVGDFVPCVRDMNCLSYDALKDSGFLPILQLVKPDDLDLTIHIMKLYFEEHRSLLETRLIAMEQMHPMNVVIKSVLGELYNAGGRYDEAIKDRLGNNGAFACKPWSLQRERICSLHEGRVFVRGA